MFLKLMNGDGFTIIEVTSASFRRLEKPVVVYREVGEEQERRAELCGNAFLLNADGNTFEKFTTDRKAGHS